MDDKEYSKQQKWKALESNMHQGKQAPWQALQNE